MVKKTKILRTIINKKRTNSVRIPSNFSSPQAYYSDIGKKNKNISYSKTRNKRRTDNPREDGLQKLKKFRFKMRVISKSGKKYTRYVYTKPKKNKTILKYLSKKR